MAEKKRIIKIAIDGLCGCGKSTLAKMIASAYGFRYIDSGALYSLTALLCGKKEMYVEKDMAFLNEVEMNSDGSIYLFGKNYTEEISLPQVQCFVSEVAQSNIVRQKINDWIYAEAQNHSIVMDGRDIGSVVFPDADIKLYLYSSIEYRMCKWDHLQMERYGFIDPEVRAEFRANMERRDYNDLHREIAPLICTIDAIPFDMEQYNLETVFSIVCEKINSLLN